MRHFTMLFVLLFALAGIAAFAQSPACPSGVIPPPEEEVLVAPPATEPLSVCPAPGPSRPADIGAGPAVLLENLTGQEFDRRFMETMYQHHVDTAALATIGIQQATDKNIRDLSGKIRYEQTKQSQKLAVWYPELTGCDSFRVDYLKPDVQTDMLSGLSSTEFDIAYVHMMIRNLQQSRDAGLLGIEKATMPGLRDQSEIVVKSTNNEITALQRWLADNETRAVSPVS